jgi:hypothetical protein
MTDAKFSDIDGRTYKKEQCYKISVYNYAEQTRLAFDMAMAQKTESIENAIKLAVQNGCAWEKVTWGKKSDEKN